MSSVAPPRPSSPVPPRPPAPSSAGPGPGAAIDPIKLIKKWKYVLVASGVVGLVLGVVGNYVWAFTYPIFEASVIYEARPPTEIDLLDPSVIDEETMDRFMATQAERMLSATILERVTQDPRLLQEAPKWSKEFVQPDGSFDYQEAMKELADRASASAIKGTTYIRLKTNWKDPNDVTALARLLSEAYLNLARQDEGSSNNIKRDAIQRSINDITKEVDNLQQRRSRLIRDQEVTGIVEQATTTREKLSLIARERNNNTLEMRAMEVQLQQMNDMIRSESGVRYSDTQHAMAESQPIMQQLRGQKELLETRLKELRRSGFLPSHREYKNVEIQIASIEQQLSITKERELSRLFDAEKDTLESQLRQAQAKEADLQAREAELEVQLQDLTKTIQEIRDISDQIGQMNQTLGERRRALEDIQTTSQMEGRIVVAENARVPDRRSAPKLMLMAAAGVFLIGGLVSGVILAVEFLDQRVKGASDLAAMSRTRVLGAVPLSEEDPTAASAKFETVFRDADRSVIAESIRQIRTGLLKHLDEKGHRTCLVVAGMPGSGSTSMMINLGMACASADRRVLLIDANFRRPALHRLLGIKEQPGLGEVLKGAVPLREAVQRVGDGVDVLAAGAPEHRVFERLGTQPMGELLTLARADYDLIFLDTAPAVVSGDAKALAQRCDASILVTRALAEKRGMVARIKNELNDSPAELVGVIVNAVRSAAGGYLKRNIRTSAAYHAGEAGTGGGKDAPEKSGGSA